MNNLANKEKNLNSLIEKLGNLSKSYAHDSIGSEKLKIERDNFLNEKNVIEITTKFPSISTGKSEIIGKNRRLLEIIHRPYFHKLNFTRN